MNLDRPMTFNELIDEKKLDEEYESIKIKIKELLKLTSPLTEFDEDEQEQSKDCYEENEEEESYMLEGRTDLQGVFQGGGINEEEKAGGEMMMDESMDY